ncbi:hypothetical protein FHX49_001615 [Microbacterium endophyticum]|uniref:Lytic transglycosylase domain-containing protein n=1 Tax=Microbacterium endophyticum TaxID=1526412 RepID=A0A7W4YM30_9MICO|nr:hypothetical protein [Microbacterium endophyticum]MBB2976045.1 hypothetical protein [Microbacterium endophyticum]NIK35036.1 hypothetical protein [Microbacterium endophyticum]
MSVSVRPQRVRWLGIVVTLSVAIGQLTTGTSSFETRDDPTWSDVEEAQGNEEATRSEIARIELALSSAQESAAAASTAAVAAAAAAVEANEKAAAAAATATAYTQQSEAAAAAFTETSNVVGAVVSARMRAEASAPVSVQVLTSTDPDALLRSLGLLDRLHASWRSQAQSAHASADFATALELQAAAAESARKESASAAEKTAASAQAAADDELRAVAEVQERADTMYAQLAALKNTTAEVERAYQLSTAVAAQEPSGPPTNATEDPDPSPTSPSAPSTPSTPSPEVPTYGVTVDPEGAKAYARGALGNYGWGDDQFGCLVSLWNRESGWRADALNPSSGAYGIPQALPGSKMAAAGADWRTNGNTQVNWGLAYIKDHYSTPCGAWAHSESTGWY